MIFTLLKHILSKSKLIFQEVIGALITHIGSGYGMEIDAAFTVAKWLSENCTEKMIPFTIFFKVHLIFFY